MNCGLCLFSTSFVQHVLYATYVSFVCVNTGSATLLLHSKFISPLSMTIKLFPYV